MASQIFPEPFYNQFLCNGERIGVNHDGNIEILRHESFCHRLKRFFTFRQDPNIDRVHDRIKSLVDQMQKGCGVDFDTLKNEIHNHGKTKYEYLEANLTYLRNKMDKIGHQNCFSEGVLKVINAVRHLFKMSPIQLKAYSWYIRGVFNRSYIFDGDNFGKEGLKLTEDDAKSCSFTTDTPKTKEIIQKLERGLEDCFLIDMVSKTFDLPGGGQERICINLEISCVPKTKQFFVQFNSLRNPIYDPKKYDVNTISQNLACYLHTLPEEKKTFSSFVKAKNTKGTVSWSNVTYTLIPTQKAPYILNIESRPLFLELDTEYSFCNENTEVIYSLKISNS